MAVFWRCWEISILLLCNIVIAIYMAIVSICSKGKWIVKDPCSQRKQSYRITVLTAPCTCIWQKTLQLHALKAPKANYPDTKASVQYVYRNCHCLWSWAVTQSTGARGGFGTWLASMFAHIDHPGYCRSVIRVMGDWFRGMGCWGDK